MKINESFKFVLNYMNNGKTRVFLTLLGIMIGIFTFSFFIFVSNGLSDAISNQFSSFGGNILAVQPANNQAFFGPPTGGELTNKEYSELKQVLKNAKYIAPGIVINDYFFYGNKKFKALAFGYQDKYLTEVEKDLSLNPYLGRELKMGDKGVLVLGYKLAFDPNGKQLIKVGSSIKVKNKNFRVIGINKEHGDFMIDNSIEIPFSDLKSLSWLNNTYSVFRISFPKGTDLNYMTKVIDRKLNPNNKAKKVDVTSAKQIMEKLNNIIGVLGGIIIFISFIALLVGGINVMNSIYSNVIERTNEISVMKAIGGTNYDILSLFLIESLLLGFFGSLFGFLLSFGFAKFVSILVLKLTSYEVPINFNLKLFILTLFFTSLFTTIFGLYPAYKATKVNPADNLRDE